MDCCSESPYFSIILPVYNGERFLAQTLDSVLGQTYSNFELIVINDGSMDSTLEICQHYTSLESRIKLINKKNEGVSVARNYGLDAAQGKYIIFVDGDDILYSSALEKLYDQLHKKSWDYLRYEYKTIDEKGADLYPNYGFQKRKKYVGCQLDAADCVKYLVRGEFFLWAGTFKRSIVETHRLRFLEGCTFCEDALFITQYLSNSLIHSYVDNVLYGYRKNENAVTAHISLKNRNDLLKVVNQLIALHASTDGKVRKSIKQTVEYFTFSLLLEAFVSVSSRCISFCMKKPISWEWKLANLMGVNTALRVYPVILMIKKVIRKIWLIVSHN